MVKVDGLANAFLDALKDAGFKGELCADLANRIACSTDNSIYQIMPQAVVYPRDGTDLECLMRIAQAPPYKALKLYARGGGTSTNGQTLGDGIVVDTSRHMQRILDFDADAGLIRVEPGLVRDALNDFLAQNGQFFAPHVSTTNRATLGGMVSNDSSGKGSLIYGKTSDHIESIEAILANGKTVDLGRIHVSQLAELSGPVSGLATDVERALAPHGGEISARFPDMKRGFTGYNLKDALSPDGVLDLVKLFAGSEGTLAMIKSITLRSMPIPKHTVLTVLVYPTHDKCLRAVPDLLKAKPVAIEFIDDKILGAALKSPFADDVKEVLGIEAHDGEKLSAHFFELSHDDEETLERHLQDFLKKLETSTPSTLRPIGIKVLRDAADIARVWEIRRACQGLLAGFDRNKRAVAFIEDCAVPPENLADFVGELERVLSDKKIPLGMYGHADVGCVHIRPLMNLNADDERKQIRVISDAVFDLTRKYGGLLWGEHGKGLRGEYSGQVIGANLLNVMRQIKTIFDPNNRMNPGKIARPLGDETPVLKLDDVPMRGFYDEQINADLSASFANILRCDGNAACFNQDESQAFCPSYKATHDRRLSPKGRAGALRAWALARSQKDEATASALSNELTEVLDSCLACKACAGAGCSARVDIPQMKSQFLDWYHTDKRRPLSDVLVANLERMAPKLDAMGVFFLNGLARTRLTKTIMKRSFGLVDLPAFRDRRDFSQRLKKHGVQTLDASGILKLPDVKRSKSVIIVQDCFTSFFDADVVLVQIELVQKLGFIPILLSYREGGKPLHVRGFLERFKAVATKNATDLAALNKAGFTLLGVDGATTLMYRHEYHEPLKNGPEFTVLLLSEWLQGMELPMLVGNDNYTMIQHCTERTLMPETTAQWTKVFAAFGLKTRIIKAGCCGMSGLFGHEARHQDISKTLYDQTWRKSAETNSGEKLIATGYSCRSQVKRLSNVQALHPAQAILAHWPH